MAVKLRERPIKIKPAEVKVGRKVVISNPSLVNALILRRGEALKVLRRIGPVKLDDISIDNKGQVVIESDAFVSGIRALPDVFRGTAASNGACGAGCGGGGGGGNGACGAGCAGKLAGAQLTKIKNVRRIVRRR